MHRIGALTLKISFALAMAVIALVYVWTAYALALAATRWFARWFGETLAAFVVAGLLLVVCLLAAQAVVWARTRWAIRDDSVGGDRRRF